MSGELPKFGSDFLGGAFFEKEAIKGSLKGDVFGIMPETFKGKKSNSWNTVEAFVESKKFSEGVVHMTPFDRDHKYPVDKLKPLLKRNAQQLEELARTNQTQILASPFCENRHDKKTMQELFAWLRPLCPSCLLVNSSLNAGVSIPGIILEIHLEAFETLPKVPNGEYIISFDGFGGNKKFPTPVMDTDIDAIIRLYQFARHIRIWDARYNGKFDPQQKDAPEPNKRTFWPSVEYIRGHRMSLKLRDGAITYKGKNLYKTFSDDHGAKEPTKDNRALVIIPDGGEHAADVFDSKGNKIDSMARFLPDHPDGKRYYSKKHAYQNADKAVKNTGSCLITIKSGKVTLPPTDGYLRSKPKS